MQLNSNSWEKDFEILYKGNRILVRNEGPLGERLYINSVLLDQNSGPQEGRLLGYLYDPNHNTEKIEVQLGGTDELECLIYADGNLIYSSKYSYENTGKQPLKSEPKKRSKANVVILFSVILIIAVTFLFMMPFLVAEQPDKGPADTVKKEKTEVAEPTEQAVSAEQEVMIESDFIWNYLDRTWNYHLEIPKSAYDYYKTIDRKKITNYSYYVKDTSDDEYLASLANQFKESAEKENDSDMDIVDNIICFVQNLEYVDDKVGTGYDEYPKFPLETLADQGGDCEDSAILLASLLRELGYGTVLIQLPNHMAVGVRGNDSVPGVYYEVNGVRYYYVETTSTGWKIGDVPEQMKGKSAQILTLE